jgi:RND family efflux transporter MFP subunit
MNRFKRIITYPKRHKKRALVILIIIVILSFVFAPKKQIPIEAQKVGRQNIIESVTASGSIASETSVTLNFLAGGKLTYVGAKKGDFVEAGQTIAALDQRTIQKNLETALRNYSLQRNAFDQLADDQNDHTPQDALNDEMKRILESNQYDLDKAVISVELQQLAREQAFLVSPIKGVVTKADAKVAGVNVTATAGFTIDDPEHVIFMAEVDEADIGKVSVGMPVEVVLESYPNDPITLTVTNIDFTSHTSSNGGNVFTVEAAFPDNLDHKYRIGMKGDAEIILSRKQSVLTVPLASIFDESYVYIKKGETYEKRKISLGAQSDIDVEVSAGIAEGNEVVLLPDEVDKFLKKNKKKYILF